jgi:opacity protein-like surface antigen
MVEFSVQSVIITSRSRIICSTIVLVSLAVLVSGCANWGDNIAGGLQNDRPIGSYVGVGGGANFWTEQSNSADLESGSEAGFIGAVDAGIRYGKGRLGIELSGRRDEVHGINGDRNRGSDGLCLYRDPFQERCLASGDGNTLYSLTLHGIATYEPVVWYGLRPYALVGVGVTVLHGRAEDVDRGRPELDDTALTPSGQVGLGIAYQLSPRVDLDLGWRYLHARETELDELDIEYRTNAVMLAARFKLGGT